jgi:hypothetical protein
LGIVYEIRKTGGKYYKKLYSLPAKQKETPKEAKAEVQPTEPKADLTLGATC